MTFFTSFRCHPATVLEFIKRNKVVRQVYEGLKGTSCPPTSLLVSGVPTYRKCNFCSSPSGSLTPVRNLRLSLDCLYFWSFLSSVDLPEKNSHGWRPVSVLVTPFFCWSTIVFASSILHLPLLSTLELCLSLEGGRILGDVGGSIRGMRLGFSLGTQTSSWGRFT